MSWGVSPDLFSFLTGFAGFLGLTESRPLGKVENRKLGRAEDRLTEGWPAGRSIGGDASHRLPKAAPQEEQIGKSANQMSGSEHPRDSACPKGKTNV